MALRQQAIRRAEERHPAVAEHLLETHGVLLPRHALYVAAFFLGLEPKERDAAWSLDAGALFGIGQWFQDGALDKIAYGDERVHGRFRRDPPEMLTFVSGNSDGSHWGLWYDDPDELPRVCAHNWARDSAETAEQEPTLLASIHARATRDEERRRGVVDKSTLAWLEELLPLERRAHAAERIPDPPARTHLCIGGMDPALVTVPPDLFFLPREAERLDAYRVHAPVVDAAIARVEAELAGGQPVRALFLGRELHWFDDDAYRSACTRLLVGAYRALGRDALAEITLAHHAARDAPSVDAYVVSSSPFHLAAERGDAVEVARLLDGPEVTSEALHAAASRTRSDAVRTLLFARDPSTVEDALASAILRASPRYRADGGEVAAKADVEALLAHPRAATLPIEPIAASLIDAHLFDTLLPLLARVDVAWRRADGATLLHVAARAGAIEAAQVLLARGADRTTLDGKAQSPRDLAKLLWSEQSDVGSRMLELLREPAAPAEPAAPSGIGPIVAGERVVHAKFGEGRVEAAKDGKLTIQFADGSRTLLERFVKRAL